MARRFARLTVLGCGVVAGVALLIAPAGATESTAAAIHTEATTTSDQVVVVSADTERTSVATVTAYAWTGDEWRAELGPYRAGIGENGFTAAPHEGDGFTPVGQYHFTMIFGAEPDPGVPFGYRRVTGEEYWVDDPQSPLYNTFQTGEPAGRWTSAETLSNYSYAAAFDFNQNPVVPDANSAIFLHDGGGPSLGCVELDESNLLAVLRWLNPAAHPLISLGVGALPPSHPPGPPHTAAQAAAVARAPSKATTTTSAAARTDAAAFATTSTTAEPTVSSSTPAASTAPPEGAGPAAMAAGSGSSGGSPAPAWGGLSGVVSALVALPALVLVAVAAGRRRGRR